MTDHTETTETLMNDIRTWEKRAKEQKSKLSKTALEFNIHDLRLSSNILQFRQAVDFLEKASTEYQKAIFALKSHMKIATENTERS